MSGRKTTAAVLRAEIGIKDREMAEMLGCAPTTIHSVESGRLRLNEDLARRMSHETGISVSWLLEGNPKAAPIAVSGLPYSKEIYEKFRAGKKWVDRQPLFFRTLDAAQFCAQLVAILEEANARRNYSLAAFKTGRALQSLKDEFGQDEEYPWNADSRWGGLTKAIEILERLVDQSKQASKIASKPTRPSKRSSSRRRAKV